MKRHEKKQGIATKISGITESAASHGPSELARLDYLDGWRGIAIGLVLIGHFAGTAGLLDAGRAGVDVFFCLSGFLMSNILFVRRVPLDTFYKRRLSRVFPVFLLFAVATYAIGWYVTGSFLWLEFVSTAVFLRTYIPTNPGIWQSQLPIGHLWSLNTEEHSYVFLSLITLLVFLRGREFWALIVTGIVSICIGIAYVEFPKMSPPSGELGTEVAAATLLLSAGYFLIREHFARFVMPWMPVFAFAAAMFCYFSLAPWWSRLIVSPFLLAFSVNHLSETPAFARRALAWPGIRLLGIWSYSIYIWQQPFYKFQDYFAPGLALLATMLVSICSFYWFENPIREWLNKNW